MMHRRRLTNLLVVLPLALVLLAGCPFSPKKDTKPPDDQGNPYLAQTTIPNVLANLIRSYQEKNYEEYRKLLDTAYEYIFAPQDISEPNGIPPSWGLPDELTSANNMFNKVPNKDGYWAEDITLSFTAGPDTQAEINPDWRKVVLSNVNLSITGRNETSADPLIYQVIGDKAELYFVLTNETDSTSGQRIYKIIRWEDKPIAAIVAAKM